MKLLTQIILITCISTVALGDNAIVTYLEPEAIVDYKPLTRRIGFVQNELRIYCYRGSEKTLTRIFESVELLLDIADEDYMQYEGITPSEVEKHYEEQRSLFSFTLFAQKRPRLQISPFGQQCIGIETTQAYRVKIHQLRVDFWRVIQLTIGVLLFIYAGHLSHNVVFFYLTGITLGICSSFMLVIWLASKLVPKRPVMYGVLIGGWTIGIYMIQLLWENIQVIVLTYRSYVFWYILTTGMISFLFCYRWGPPKNERSKNIIKWTLQFLAFVIVYLSSYFEEATLAVMVITASMHYFPSSLLRRLQSLYLRRFPPKRRLLTNEEYYEQGVKETTKALEELRKFAGSPDCKQWRLMSQLRDPMRFAAFVEGASHLRDEEILRFESSHMDDSNENDSEMSSDENDIDNNVNVNENDISEEEDEEEQLTVESRYQRYRRLENNFIGNPPQTHRSPLPSQQHYSPTYSMTTRERRPNVARINNSPTVPTYRRTIHERSYKNNNGDEY